MAQDRLVKENAFQRSIRLLARMNNELIQPGSGDELVMVNQVDGGQIRFVHDGDEMPIFTAVDNEQLIEYMEAPPLRRLIMTATQAA